MVTGTHGFKALFVCIAIAQFVIVNEMFDTKLLSNNNKSQFANNINVILN